MLVVKAKYSNYYTFDPVHYVSLWICMFFQDAEEYTDLPVRHNEDHMNSELAKCLPLESNPHSFDSPHTKAHLLLQAHLSRTMLPCPDYDTDTKTVLDQALRVCQVWKSFLIIYIFSSSFWVFSFFFSPVVEENMLVFKHFYCSITEKNLVNQIRNFWRKRKCKCNKVTVSAIHSIEIYWR